jgi:hypothetical protein
VDFASQSVESNFGVLARPGALRPYPFGMVPRALGLAAIALARKSQ